jgi:transcriptional regulator with XRE-family HTH domain
MRIEPAALTAWADALAARRQPAIPPSTEPVLRGALEALAVLRERASVADAKLFLREVVAFGEAVGTRGAGPAAPSQAARLRVLAEDLLLDPTVLHGDRAAFEAALLAGLRRVFRGAGVPREGATPVGLEHAVAEARMAYVAADGGVVALDRIRRILDLSEQELGRVLRVSRQAVEQWRQRGIPAERRADVDRLLAAADWLYESVLPERIPQVVRRPVPALGDRSMLAFAQDEGPLALLQHLARLFSMQGAG